MSPHSQQCDPLPCLWGESCICFSNGPKCPHLAVSVPSHSAHGRSILDGVSRGTAPLPLLWLLSPLLGPSSELGVSSCSCNRTVLLVSVPGYGTYLSLQFSKPSQRQSPPHLCLRIPMGILCVFTGKSYQLPLGACCFLFPPLVFLFPNPLTVSTDTALQPVTTEDFPENLSVHQAAANTAYLGPFSS